MVYDRSVTSCVCRMVDLRGGVTFLSLLSTPQSPELDASQDDDDTTAVGPSMIDAIIVGFMRRFRADIQDVLNERWSFREDPIAGLKAVFERYEIEAPEEWFSSTCASPRVI